MVIGLVPAAMLFVISLILIKYSINVGALFYTISVYILTAIMIFSASCVRPKDIGARHIVLSDDERRVYEKYYAFFVFPSGTQNFARFITYAGFFGILWIGASLWNKLWLVAIFNAVYFIISTPIVCWLSPIIHYKAPAERGSTFAAKELRIIQRILDLRHEFGF